jgi:hypothetical protein
MDRLVLLLVLAGVMLCCLGVLLSLPLTAPDVSSALGEANVEHVDRAANAPAPLPDGSYYPLTPAEEAQETDSPPVNSYLLTMFLLACSFGSSVLRMLLIDARRQGALCSLAVVGQSFATAFKDLPFLGAFRL